MKPLICFVLFTTACARASVESLHPIPVSATAPDTGDVRGNTALARTLDWEEQVRVAAVLVRDFFRPIGRQVRLIDPRPLAHARSADDTVSADPIWSSDIAQASRLRKVCPADDDHGCADLPGGILRLSRVYAATRDSATVYVVYMPVTSAHERQKEGAGEMRFTVVRRDGNWKLASRLNSVGPTRSR